MFIWNTILTTDELPKLIMTFNKKRNTDDFTPNITETIMVRYNPRYKKVGHQWRISKMNFKIISTAKMFRDTN